jgi:hypothetical protein
VTNINSIIVLLNTGDQSGAGTDGDVYLGICGREFYLDTSADDFERNSSRQYVLGQGANTLNAAKNDPRNPRILVEDVDQFPVYIRFNPQSRGDNWNLIRVAVTVNDSAFPQYEALLERQGGIWLGTRSGLFFYPHKHVA